MIWKEFERNFLHKQIQLKLIWSYLEMQSTYVNGKTIENQQHTCISKAHYYFKVYSTYFKLASSPE